jgi:hypothetical protein
VQQALDAPPTDFGDAEPIFPAVGVDPAWNGRQWNWNTLAGAVHAALAEVAVLIG